MNKENNILRMRRNRLLYFHRHKEEIKIKEASCVKAFGDLLCANVARGPSTNINSDVSRSYISSIINILLPVHAREQKNQKKYYFANAVALRKKSSEYSKKNLARRRLREEKKRRGAGIKPLTTEERAEHARKYLQSETSLEKLATVIRDLGVKHPRAEFWSLISPDGIPYHFKNLSLFIKENQNLFTEEQLTAKGSKKSKIYACLSQLSPRSKNCREQMHGWRWNVDGHNAMTYLAAPHESGKSSCSEIFARWIKENHPVK